MDPRHRDRVAFVRVCSGRFTKDMAVSNSRARQAAARVARLPVLRPRSRDDQRGVRRRHHRPGQPGTVRDRRHAAHRRAAATSSTSRAFRPSTSAALRLQDTRYKQFDEGLRQLEEEGLMQVFYVDERPPRADRRRRRRAAVRRDHQPAAHRVRRRDRRSSRRRTPRRAGSPIRPSRCRCSAARRPRRSIARSGACCCSPTSGKCSTSRSRTRRSACSPSHRSRRRGHQIRTETRRPGDLVSTNRPVLVDLVFSAALSASPRSIRPR